MKLFDSHCHLDDMGYSEDMDEVLMRAKENGVEKFMVVGVNERSSEAALALAKSRPEIFASVGVHPHDSSGCSSKVIEHLKRLAKNPKVKAWGEIGLDFNRMHSPKEDQETWLVSQLEAASELDLPVIFHERDSGGRLLAILNGNKSLVPRGVVHCFSGTREELHQYLDLGFFIGITGILTIKSRGRSLRAMAENIPGDRIMIETDAPYLVPAPERNKTRRNEPAFVRSTLLKLAQVRGEDPEILAANIWGNTIKFYEIDEKT